GMRRFSLQRGQVASIGQAVDINHGIAPAEQMPNHGRTDEACPASYQDLHKSISLSWIRSIRSVAIRLLLVRSFGAWPGMDATCADSGRAVGHTLDQLCAAVTPNQGHLGGESCFMRPWRH